MVKQFWIQQGNHIGKRMMSDLGMKMDLFYGFGCILDGDIGGVKYQCYYCPEENDASTAEALLREEGVAFTIRHR